MSAVSVSPPPPTLFPIRELVRRTGVNASTLRAWENRHGLLTPTRTASGHRLYSPQDVQRIRRLQDLLGQGLSLGEIAPLLAEAEVAPSPAAETLAPQPRSTFPGAAWQGYLQETLAALEDFSTERLDSLYNEACALYPVDTVTEHLLVPVLQQLGQRWDQRPSGIAEEHFFTAWLRNKLGARLHHAASLPRGGALILACLPHEQHEIGLLVFALSALQRGYRVIYLGANMPTRQIVHVARHTHALGIVLAGRQVADPGEVLEDIVWLAQAANLPLFVGSHFSEQVREPLQAQGVIPLGGDLSVGLRLMEHRLQSQGRHPPRP
jgi:DNA-binding transcriptional MerR regulator/methylmalonyl-CoA mutase cobalamin-binding subunit